MVQIGYHIHAKKGEWTQMNDIFDRAMTVDPDKKILEGSRPVKEMVKNYRSMFWAENYNNAVRLFNEFKGSRDKTVLEKAVQKFEETATIDPSEGQTYSILATCYFELGEENLAVQNARKAANMMPTIFKLTWHWGRFFPEQEKKKQQLNSLK
jgi:tetratricopeptide (TPR) repeat protein